MITISKIDNSPITIMRDDLPITCRTLVFEVGIEKSTILVIDGEEIDDNEILVNLLFENMSLEGKLGEHLVIHSFGRRMASVQFVRFEVNTDAKPKLFLEMFLCDSDDYKRAAEISQA